MGSDYMRMKQYCFCVVHEYIRTGMIKINYRGNQPLFDFSMFHTKFHPRIGRDIRIDIGNGITMQSAIRDVIQFKKDGNLLTFNINEILAEYHEV